jgi:hypothetical protein
MFPARSRGPRLAHSTPAGFVAFLRPRVATVGLLLGLATTGLALVPQVASAVTNPYSASISPNVAQAGSSSTFTVTLTNKASTAEIKKASIKAATGFTITSVGAPSPSSFTVSRSGNEVTLSGVLRPGASLSITITATAPITPGAYKWTTKASGAAGSFINTGPDLSVTVGQQAAVVPCSPGSPCSSPTLSTGTSSKGLGTDSQVTAQAGAQPDLLTVVLPDPTASPMLCQQTNGTFGQIVTWNVTARTSTLVYTVHPTTIGYTYDLGDTCFGSTLPFLDASGNPAVQNPANGNEFEGTLPFCTVPNEPSQTNPPPCVVSIVTVHQPTDPPAVQVTVNAPQGDPKFTG